MKKSSLISSATVSALLLCWAGTQAQTLSDPNLTVTGLRTGGLSLSQPTAFLFLDSAGTDFLICEKASGQVKRMTNGIVSSTIALDLAVNSSSERGLLSLIPDPSFATNNFVYVYYSPSSTASDTTASGSVGGNHIVARYTWNATSGLLENRLVIQSDLPISGGPNHDGGVMVFGPPSAPAAEQKLFIVIGELNRNVKNSNYPTGADADGCGDILRINSDGTVPTDNPFFNNVGANSYLKRIYAYGIRNSFGMTFDELSPAPNNLWITENGPNVYDEINFVAAGFNSGWENIMGPIAANSVQNGNPAGTFVNYGPTSTYSDPEFSFLQPIAITAMHFVTGQGLGPAYVGDCIVGDVNNGKLYKFEMNPNRNGFALTAPALQDLVYSSTTDSASLSEIQFGTGFGGATRILTGADGRLYVSSISNGQIYRIQDPTVATPTATPTLSPTPTVSPSPSATASPTASPSPSDSPTPSLTLSPIPTESPTSTASPSPTATATPTASPTPGVLSYPQDFVNGDAGALAGDDSNSDNIVDAADIIGFLP